jgi:hypothetical protein
VLLHVLGQVGLLGVRLSAELADVSFEVFGLFVFGDVLQERRLIHKTLVARVTLVRFVCLVASGMGLKVAQLAEGFGAAGMPTFVGLVTCVSPDVLLQVRQLGELALTNLTLVGFNTQVYSGVL